MAEETSTPTSVTSTPIVQQQQQSRIYLVTDGLKSSHTKRAYRLAFDQFIKTTVKSNVLRALLDTKKEVIESKIIDHITYLKDVQHLSYLSIQVHLLGIFHFFKMNDFDLNTRKIKRFLPQDESDYYARDRPYAIGEIEQIVSKCDIRSRVVMLLMASTGIRIGGLRELQISDLKKIDEFSLYLIWVYNRSRNDRYYTFCTPECANAIDAYLQYRQKFGEELKDKSPLIREQFNIDNPFTANAPNFVSLRMMSYIFEDVLKRSGVNQIKAGHDIRGRGSGSGRRDVMSSHGFRKFFITQCVRANINQSTWKSLVGHKLPKPDDSYILTTEEDRLKDYAKVIDSLTISQEHKLRKENQDLKTSQAQELIMLKQKLEIQEEFLNGYATHAEWATNLFKEVDAKLKVEEERNKRLEKVAVDATRIADKALAIAKANKQESFTSA